MQPDYQTPERMAAKLKAIPLPDLTGKKVLDVGTDFGSWAFLAESRGASEVVALDRNREIRGQGKVDLIAMNRAKAKEQGSICKFHHIDLGKQWHHFGRFHVIFLFSVYHHIFENCGSHQSAWLWLAQHCRSDGELFFEGPVDDTDPVVQMNVSAENRQVFTFEEIKSAALEYFYCEHIGPALHEPTRIVLRFWPKNRPTGVMRGHVYAGTVRAGAGGASKAFAYADHRRAKEIEHIIGFRPADGSLNVMLDDRFEWSKGYFRSQVLDVKDRRKGLESEWALRWARFYPALLDSWLPVHVFRFEGEHYDEKFVELIALDRLRDELHSERVTLCA